MNMELRSQSAPGARLVELAEKHAAEFAATAYEHDRAGSFPSANWERLKQSGLLAGTVPADLGGLGVTSVHDVVVAVGRLARGDPSTAIGTAMHLTAFWYLSRLWRQEAVDPTTAGSLRLLLRRCARGHAVACVALSERGTSLGWPATTAVPEGAGYRVEGRKTFCTNSPVATLFLSTVRLRDAGAGGGEPDRLGFAVIPREVPGVEVHDNWDALGMRASGSGDVSLACEIPAAMVVSSGPLGVLPTRMFPLTMVGALVLAGAALGIAERAQELAVAGALKPARGRGAAPARRVAVQTLLAENEVDLATGRAVMSRSAALLSERLDGTQPELRRSEAHGLMKEVQCANMATKRAAIAVADRALTVSGGGGYLAANPLSKLYRDVRAGTFMQPFSALDAFEYIGRVRLGLDTDLDQSQDVSTDL
jgi:alkylation response protein AidB-like acyl-CoA dehydrogenase